MASIRYKLIKTLFKARHDALLGRNGVCAGGESRASGMLQRIKIE